MTNEAGYRFHTRMVAQPNAMQICRDKLVQAETQLEPLIDNSNLDRDVLAALKNVQDLVLHGRIILEEANK